MRTAYATCPLCEATCGLEFTIDGDRVLKVRGDEADVFSRGFICPKGGSIKALHEDPDRLRAPLIKRDGEFVEATWEEAFGFIGERLPRILEEHGRDAVAMYVGNPAVHNTSTLLYGRVLGKALQSKNVYTASTVDQMPKQVSAGYMFGGPLTIPVPDLDRTDYLLMLGANPLASNGSLMTAPDARGRLRRIRERGGRVVVVDPRRSRTAEHADEHLPIRPGTDALFLFALVHTLFEEDLTAPIDHLNGVEEVREQATPFSPEVTAVHTGIDAETTRRIARELAASRTAAVYGRIGTTLNEFGTIASWLVDVLNALTGNLDREGGAMFPLAAAGQTNSSPQAKRRAFLTGRWHSRVRKAPEVLGELPVACLAEEIETPGEGQIKALITICGNPCVSSPAAGRLDAALEGLELMISLDIYVNETSRHADVILPGPTPLERSHYDIGLYQLAVRNVANYSAPVMDKPEGMPSEWETLLRLTAIVTGQGADADIGPIDRFVALTAAQQAGAEGAESLLSELEPRTGPERLLDILLRTGPYELTLQDLEQAPHGIDLGPLKPRLPEVLLTPSGKVELAPETILADLPRLRRALDRPVNGRIVLVGRRQLRSNNSWMHNLEPLVRGKDRCTLHVHPEDAASLGLADGGEARVSSSSGEVTAPVEVTDAIRPGVVSLPHGWGHDVPGVRMRVAREHAGVNSNILADEGWLDPLSGNAILNGIPVEVAPVQTGSDARAVPVLADPSEA